jgi:hypothetical protein
MSLVNRVPYKSHAVAVVNVVAIRFWQRDLCIGKLTGPERERAIARESVPPYELLLPGGGGGKCGDQLA